MPDSFRTSGGRSRWPESGEPTRLRRNHHDRNTVLGYSRYHHNPCHWTTAGSLLGAYVLYVLGGRPGRDRTRALIGRIPLVAVDDVDRVEAWFARHGSKAVFWGRLVPLFRSLISIPAGIDRMPLWRFLGLTFAGSLIWSCSGCRGMGGVLTPRAVSG